MADLLFDMLLPLYAGTDHERDLRRLLGEELQEDDQAEEQEED